MSESWSKLIEGWIAPKRLSTSPTDSAEEANLQRLKHRQGNVRAKPMLAASNIHYDVYKGEWGNHPLVVSLANTAEPLFIMNRFGNRPSHEGAAGYTAVVR